MPDKESRSSDDLLKRLIEAEPGFAAHHQVMYAASALDIAAVLAERHPYSKGDPYETGLDLLDEAGAAVRVRRLGQGSDNVEVGLRVVAASASKKTGLSIQELLSGDE